MNPSKNQSASKWFYIKHLATDKVISATQPCNTYQVDEYVRSKVFVTKQHYTDNELWCWDENYLKNKSSGLVLDIRKAKLRLIEDTEICLFYKKPYEMSQNQLWAVRPATASDSHHPLSKRSSSQSSPGIVIHSVCNDGWVLDVCCPEESSPDCERKLVLFPEHQVDSSSQKWEFIPENYAQHNDASSSPEPSLIFDDNMFESSIVNENSYGFSSVSSSASLESMGYAHGLSPAKRSSQSSLNSLSKKTTLEEEYIYQTPRTHTICL